MQTFFVDAYDQNTHLILGNLHGQRRWRGRDFKRTKWYRALRSGNQRLRYERVERWQILDEKGTIRSVVLNPHHASYSPTEGVTPRPA